MQTFPEPTWNADHVQKIETSCANSMYAVRNPYMLTGFFVQWVRSLFKTPDNILNKMLKGYVWDDDPKSTKITIDPSFKDNPDDERRRPGIYIKRTSVSQTTPGMQGGLHTLHTGDDGFFRGKHLSSILSGGHSFTCVGDTEAEAESIALEVFDNLLRYSAAIKEVGNLGVFWVETLSGTQHAPEGKDYWICSINTKWHYTYNWTLDRDAPILKEIGYGPIL